MERMTKYGYRDLPTALYPELPPNAVPANPPVTLTTAKYYDLVAQIRANFSRQMTNGKYYVDKETHPDLDPDLATMPFSRPEPQSTWRNLPSLRPSTMFVLGDKTYLNLRETRQGISTAGTGVGGSGGIEQNRVCGVILPGQTHVFPLIAVQKTAELCFEWLNQELNHYHQWEEKWNAERSSMSSRDHWTVGRKWREILKPMKDFKTKL